MMYKQFNNHVKFGTSLWLAVALVSLLASSLFAQQNEKEGAKSMFYNPPTGAVIKPPQKARRPAKSGMPQQHTDKIPAVKPVSSGLHYWFELEGVGKVSDDHVFYTGDRVHLHVRSNMDGYLTLWAYDPSGQSELLFPSSSSTGDNKALSFSEDKNFVRANTDYSPGTITFRPPAEDERLLIFFSQSKNAVPSPQKSSLTAEQIKQATQPEGNRSLLFETEKKDPETFGSYVANRQGDTIAKDIRLKHRPRKVSQE